MTPPLKSTTTALKSSRASRTPNEPPKSAERVQARFCAFDGCDLGQPENDWFQTFPAYGRYPVGNTCESAAKDAVFVLDEATAKDIVADFRRQREAHPDWPGILVDREHFSCDPDKPSDAMAWATDIRVNDDGSIWTKWEFTPKGTELWLSKTLVNRSPCFLSSANAARTEFRPCALVSIGMTNTPHFKDLSALAAARAAEAKENEKGKLQMEKILAALGLPPEATEDDAVGAVNALKEKASAAETKATECQQEKEKCEAECRGMKADAFLKDNAERIADPAKCREVYMKDPELAEQMLACCKKAEKPAEQQVLAAAKAKRPETDSDVLKQLASCKSAEERCTFAVQHAAELAALGK